MKVVELSLQRKKQLLAEVKASLNPKSCCIERNEAVEMSEDV